MPRLVLLSDTHGQHGSVSVPDGDVLVFAGDACGAGTPTEWKGFCAWLGTQPHAHKVVIAGNHDWPLQPSIPEWNVRPRYGPTERGQALRRVEDAGAVLLQDSGATVAGLRFWGSPWVPFFYDWAFNLPRGGERLAELRGRIPAGLDVLVTHGPPHGVLDLAASGVHAGCEPLADRLAVLDAEGGAPRLHVFGDIHEAAGVLPPAGVEGRISVNAAVLDLQYRLVRGPVVLDLEAGA